MGRYFRLPYGAIFRHRGCGSWMFAGVGDVFLLGCLCLRHDNSRCGWHALLVSILGSRRWPRWDASRHRQLQTRCMVCLILVSFVHAKIEALDACSMFPDSWRPRSRGARRPLFALLQPAIPGRSGFCCKTPFPFSFRPCQAFAGAWSRDCNRHNSHLCPMDASSVRRVARWSLRDLALASLRFPLDGQDGS